MLRDYAIYGRAGLVAMFLLLLPRVVAAQTATPTPTANACATDAASRWATVMAYESPTPTETPTPTATPTRGVDLVTERVFQYSDVIHAEVCNIGDEDAICAPAADLVDVNVIDCTNDATLTGEMIYDTDINAGACEIVTFDESDLILAAHHDMPYAIVRGSVNDGNGYGGYYVDEQNHDNASACVNIYVPTPTPTATPSPAPFLSCEITATVNYSQSLVTVQHYIYNRFYTYTLGNNYVLAQADFAIDNVTALAQNWYLGIAGVAVAGNKIITLQHEHLIDQHEVTLFVRAPQDDDAPAMTAECATTFGAEPDIDEYYRDSDDKLWRYRREVSLGVDKIGDALHCLLTPAILALAAGGAILIIWQRRT